MATSDQLRLLALCAIEGISGAKWQVLAREAQTYGLEGLLRGDVRETSKTGRETAAALRDGLHRLDDLIDQVEVEVHGAGAVGAQLVTVLDDDYPSNLREVRNLPPFLFVRGSLTAVDARSVAVIGTRRASREGLDLSAKVAAELARRGVTVVSGLARGIDSAAHEAALEVGGRTIAVVGTGILRCYPPENDHLAERITRSGAIVSQFWPDQPPGRHTFPIRNVVTSGISQGSVVIEASATSGAKLQARKAVEHGKTVFLVSQLVTDQPWAQDFVRSGKAVEVSNLRDIMARLRDVGSDDTVARGAEQIQLTAVL